MISIVLALGAKKFFSFFLLPGYCQYRNTILNSIYGIRDTEYWQSIGKLNNWRKKEDF